MRAGALMHLEDGAFVDRLRRGEAAAFRILVRRHHGALVRLARGFCRSEATAEDVVQEAWLAVVTGLAGFTGAAPLRSWIAAIVVNKARTRAVRDARMRSFSELPSVSGGDDGGFDLDRFAADGGWVNPPQPWQAITPERVVAGRQAAAHAGALLDRLPASQRAAVLLRDVQGLEPRDICTALEITDGHLRVLLHRARARLRAAVERPAA